MGCENVRLIELAHDYLRGIEPSVAKVTLHKDDNKNEVGF